MHKRLITFLVCTALASVSLPAAAQSSRDGQPSGDVINAPEPNYADSMARLQEGAQRLREAIQHMARQPRASAATLP
jgi:hypothetical protein